MSTILAGKYELSGLLGRGGMGEVHEATHRATGRRVAIKLLAVDAGKGDSGSEEAVEEAASRFAREARAAGRINSPHVVEVLDAGVDDVTHQPFLVMEFLTGQDVNQLLRKVGPLPVHTALKIIAQACLGLMRAHDAGVVHRDIKPANLFIAEREGRYSVKVVDFGIARLRRQGEDDLTQDLTRTGSMLGSPTYMAPEQVRGLKDIDGRADIWSMGVVLYKLLSGRAPHEKGGAGVGELLITICTTPPPLLQRFAPWVPKPVAELVHHMLQIDVARRIASAADLYEQVVAQLPGGQVELHTSDLVGLSEDERAATAEMASVTGRGPVVDDVSDIPVHEATAVDQTRLTMGGPRSATGSAPTSIPPSKAGRVKRLIAAASATIVLGVAIWRGAVYMQHTRISTSSEKPEVERAPTLVLQEAELTVPANTLAVYVDGQPATFHDARVMLRGPLGSVHTVVARGPFGDIGPTSVQILSSGATAPAKLEVPAQAPRPDGTTPASAAAPTTVKPIRAGATVRPSPGVTSATTPKPTATGAAAAPAGLSTVFK